MLNPQGQAGLEGKILSSASDSQIRPWPWPQAFVFSMSSNLLFWSHENECNDGTDNRCEFAIIIYHNNLLTFLVLLI